MTEKFEQHTCLARVEILAIETRDQGVNPEIYLMQIEQAHLQCQGCNPMRSAS